MKRRTFIITLLAGTLLATGLSSTALAHGGKGKRGFNVDKRVEKMTQRLDLSEDQSKQVRSILESKKDQFKAIRGQKIDREQKRTQMRELRKSTRAEIAQVLDDEQKAKVKKFKKRRRHKRAHRGHPFSEKRIEKTAERLGLDDAQVSKIKSIVSDAKAERELILEAADGDRSAARGELRAHRSKVRTRIEAVMTPDQLEKARELRQQRKRTRRGKRQDD